MKKCKHPIEFDITYDEHDVNIFDTKHKDNYITMTRDEAKFIVKKLKDIL